LVQNALNFAVMNPDIINDGRPVKRKRCGGGRAFHSRLESFVDFIREQRQRRKTWQEIAAVLSNEKSCAITSQGVHQFYRRYHDTKLASLKDAKFDAAYSAVGKLNPIPEAMWFWVEALRLRGVKS
jgi:hypothetical protein